MNFNPLPRFAIGQAAAAFARYPEAKRFPARHVALDRMHRDIGWGAAGMRVTNHAGLANIVRRPARRGRDSGREL